MAKVVCESCGSSFPLERVKDMQNCPVCGEKIWDDSDDTEEGMDGYGKVEDDSEKGLMYFDKIVEYEDAPEYSHVSVYCGECKEFNDLELDKFDKFVDKEYVILKSDIELKCRGCGKEHKPRKILYKKKEQDTSLRPRCPICNSPVLKKIKTSSKILAAATLGTFALPYNSKTYECQNCNYRF